MSSESTSDSEAVVLAVVDLVVFVVVKDNFSVVEEALPATGSTLLMVGCGTTAGSCCGGGWPTAAGGGSRGWSPYWGANWLEYCCWNCCTYGE